MKTAELDYVLPEELIASRPAAERDGGRLLVAGRDAYEHRQIADFPELVPEGAVVVVNDTRVYRSRLIGARHGTGGRVELLLLAREGGRGGIERWTALGRANKPLRSGTRIDVGPLEIEVESRDDDGTLHVDVHAEGGVEAALERHGHVPIPPYLRREDDAEDIERYQTVYARHPGSVAAPTAGLHLSTALLSRLEARGVELGRLVLHVGVGTFRPVAADDLDDHPMHTERIDVGAALAGQVRAARRRGAAVIAIGTTVVRALESAADPQHPGEVRPFAGETRLLIQPGYRFRVVDGLFTNFHMPRSTLLALVMAFAGRERTLGAYEEAVRRSYAFLSYGDAMWIPERLA